MVICEGLSKADTKLTLNAKLSSLPMGFRSSFTSSLAYTPGTFGDTSMSSEQSQNILLFCRKCRQYSSQVQNMQT